MKYPNVLREAEIFDQIDKTGKAPVTTFQESDEHEIATSQFTLSFTSNGAGFSFPCDSAGNVLDKPDRRQLARDNEAWAKDPTRDWENIEILPWTHRFQRCSCGSDVEPEKIYDARGIYLTRACPRCQPEKLSRFRPEVLTNPRYEADEDIDGDY
jgi:hypothetical protein